MSYKMLQHTADVRMYVSGESAEEVFRDAMAGLMSVLEPDVDGNTGNGESTEGKHGIDVERSIEVRSVDRTALLIDFLNEILYLSQMHREMYERVEFSEFSEKSLRAEIFGKRAEGFGTYVKGVTYHEAELVEESPSKWVTTIIFDV